MRALLIVNPMATTTTQRGLDVLTRALASDLSVTVAETKNRGHAAALACRAARGGRTDVVVALGGDGTVNEVVNGLLTDGPRADLPALAVVPGGSTNVFARTLGIANDPVEATGEILDALRAGRSRSIGLGRADERWFTFTAGFGFDAEVVRRVERWRRRGGETSHARFVRSAVAQFLFRANRRRPAITVEIPGEEPREGVYFALVGNTSPWTYLGSRPVRPMPTASYETGLDLFAPTGMGLVRTLSHVRRALSARPSNRGRRLVRGHDLTEFTLTARRPLAFELDGDYLGERRQIRFTATPKALRVIV